MEFLKIWLSVIGVAFGIVVAITVMAFAFIVDIIFGGIIAFLEITGLVALWIFALNRWC